VALTWALTAPALSPKKGANKKSAQYAAPNEKNER